MFNRSAFALLGLLLAGAFAGAQERGAVNPIISGPNAQVCFEPSPNAGADTCIKRVSPGVLNLTPGNGPGSAIGGGSPVSNIQILSRNCFGQANCTTVKWDAGTSTLADATTTSGSNIVTCPECKFQTGAVGTQFPPATVGQVFYATDSTAAVPGVNTCLVNPVIQFGALNQTTISSVDSDTQVHVVGNAGTSSVAKACIAWGDDDTTAINAAWAAGGCTTALSMPSGSTIFSAPIWQKNAGCTYNNAGPYFGQRVAGSNLGGTYLIPVPAPGFNFAPITGGQGTTVSCLTCTAAIGNPLIFDYRDFGIFGLGQTCSALASTDLFLAGLAARVVNVNGVGWCGNGGGNTLVGFHFLGDEDLFSQGGANYFGSIEAAVDAHIVTFSANFTTGMSSTTAGVAKCGLLVGNFVSGSNLYTVNNSTNTCAQLGNSGGTTTGSIVSMNSQINGNPNGTPDGACLFVGLNSVANFNSNDSVCPNAKVNETAINFFSTGATVRSLYGAFTANGTPSVITGAAGNTFKDEHDNTFTGGVGVWNGLGNWLGDGSPTTPVPTISSGFGTTPAILKTSGATSFTVNVGTGGTATAGVIGLSAARNGWTCQVYNQTAHASNRADDTVQTANTTSTVTVQNQTKSTGAAVAWTASDTLNVSCRAN